MTGYIVQREVIADALRNGRVASGRSRSGGRDPVRFIPEHATLAQALKVFLDEREHMLMVVDEYGGVSGLVTLEDLLESILGAEIIDEMDLVEDPAQVGGRACATAAGCGGTRAPARRAARRGRAVGRDEES